MNDIADGAETTIIPFTLDTSLPADATLKLSWFDKLCDLLGFFPEGNLTTANKVTVYKKEPKKPMPPKIKKFQRKHFSPRLEKFQEEDLEPPEVRLENAVRLAIKSGNSRSVGDNCLRVSFAPNVYIMLRSTGYSDSNEECFSNLLSVKVVQELRVLDARLSLGSKKSKALSKLNELGL